MATGKWSLAKVGTILAIAISATTLIGGSYVAYEDLATEAELEEVKDAILLQVAASEVTIQQLRIDGLQTEIRRLRAYQRELPPDDPEYHEIEDEIEYLREIIDCLRAGNEVC
jgi:hypothetical protein